MSIMQKFGFNSTIFVFCMLFFGAFAFAGMLDPPPIGNQDCVYRPELDRVICGPPTTPVVPNLPECGFAPGSLGDTATCTGSCPVAAMQCQAFQKQIGEDANIVETGCACVCPSNLRKDCEALSKDGAVATFDEKTCGCSVVPPKTGPCGSILSSFSTGIASSVGGGLKFRVKGASGTNVLIDVIDKNNQVVGTISAPIGGFSTYTSKDGTTITFEVIGPGAGKDTLLLNIYPACPAGQQLNPETCECECAPGAQEACVGVWIEKTCKCIDTITIRSCQTPENELGKKEDLQDSDMKVPNSLKYCRDDCKDTYDEAGNLIFDSVCSVEKSGCKCSSPDEIPESESACAYTYPDCNGVCGEDGTKCAKDEKSGSCICAPLPGLCSYCTDISLEGLDENYASLACTQGYCNKGEVCKIIYDGGIPDKCICVQEDAAPLCENQDTGACEAGLCTEGKKCQLVERGTGEQCACITPPDAPTCADCCTSLDATSCTLGLCENGMDCAVNEAGDACECAPAPSYGCGSEADTIDDGDICTGDCPYGQYCSVAEDASDANILCSCITAASINEECSATAPYCNGICGEDEDGNAQWCKSGEGGGCYCTSEGGTKISVSVAVGSSSIKVGETATITATVREGGLPVQSGVSLFRLGFSSKEAAISKGKASVTGKCYSVGTISAYAYYKGISGYAAFNCVE